MGAPQQVLAGLSSAALSAATWDPTAKNSNITLSNGNRTATAGAAFVYQPGRALDATLITSGQKKYFEVTLVVLGSTGSTSVGVANASNLYTDGSYLGLSNNSIGYFDDATVLRNNSVIATYGTPVAGNVIGVAVWGGNSLWFSINGVWQSGDPNTLTGGLTTMTTMGDVYPAYNVVNNTAQSQVLLNPNPSSFPTGFSRLAP